MKSAQGDRFGLGWRPELGAALLPRLDRLDLLEVMIEDVVRAGRDGRAAFAALSRAIPVTLHGTQLGLAGTDVVATRRLDAVARVVAEMRPAAWSEHLAFVRAGGTEIGHLAAPARNERTLEAVARNVARATQVVGAPPLVENVATLVEPPGADRSEPRWLCDVVCATGATLLLDLHNWHVNAVNFGFDAVSALDALPMHRVRQIHVAGGATIRRGAARRLLDDHRHATPPAVFDLLEEAARRAPGALDVLLERDGAFPPVEELFGELDRARAAVRRGRARPIAAAVSAANLSSERPVAAADARGFSQAGWARVLRDPGVRARFLADPTAEGPRLGLGRGPFDLEGVVLAAASLDAKRAADSSAVT